MSGAYFGSLFCVVVVLGCLNDYVPNQQAIEAGRSALKALEPAKIVRPWAEARADLTRKLATDRSKETLNDLAVALIHLGENKQAIPLLEEVESRFPGEYRTATNLGTAYELDGRIDDALRWIREGIERNPQSHEGTEWLHVRILEAKQGLKEDPLWLRRNRVSGCRDLDLAVTSEEARLKTEEDPEQAKEASLELVLFGKLPKGNKGEALDAKQVWLALQHQLRERLPFTPKPDEIVSQLLEDYADLTTLTSGGAEGSPPLFRLAAEYSAENRNELEARAVSAGRTRSAARRETWYSPRNLVGLVILCSPVLCLVGWLVSRRLLPTRTTLHRTFAAVGVTCGIIWLALAVLVFLR